jgi:hypothetical protein
MKTNAVCHLGGIVSRTFIVPLALAFLALLAVSAPAQVPADLQAAIQARSDAVSKADAATWDRLTTDDFTVVLRDGTLLTKAERLAQLKTATPAAPRAPQEREIKRYGDVVIERVLTADTLWVLDVWVKDLKGWRVAAVQVTAGKK